MSRYRPGTADDLNALVARGKRARRQLAEANSPGKTQIYQTTAKVSVNDQKIDQAIEEARKAMEIASRLTPATNEQVDRLFTDDTQEG